jgi:hypothetical protein
MSTSGTELELRVAADRVAIMDVMARYATAVDAHRIELLADVFVDGATVDFRPNGGIYDTYPGIADYLDTAMSSFAASQHYLSNFVTDVDGDHARSRFYVFTQMITAEGGRDHILADGGFYDATFVRTPKGWRVQSLVGGLVWWDGPTAPPLPWYGKPGNRF